MFFFSPCVELHYKRMEYLKVEKDKLKLFMKLNGGMELKEKFYIMNTVLHYSNEIFFTKWPFFLSLGVLFLIYSLVLFFAKVSISIFLVVGLISVIVYLFTWFKELSTGRHTLKVKEALLFGFFLFLCSEATLFAGFFWSLLDRVFSATCFISFSSLPSGLDRIKWFGDPLRATLILLCSGYLANMSYYYYLDRHLLYGDLCWVSAIFLGLLFLYIQYSEYSHLINDIRDSVWYSHMYLLTGFHGFHVIIGLGFLSYQFCCGDECLYETLDEVYALSEEENEKFAKWAK